MARPRMPSDTAHDPLGEALHQLRLAGVLYCQAELTAPWGIAIPDLDGCLGFLVVTQGRCLLEVDGLTPRWIERGGVGLVPGGRPHRVRSRPRARTVALEDLPVEQLSSCYERVRFGGGGDITRITYGVLRFDRPAARQLLEVLPPLLHIDSFGEDIENSWLREAVRLINHEAAALRVGGEAMVTRLADMLVIQVLRNWLDSAPEAQHGWIAAVRDPQLGRALAAMHRNPATPWTLQSLSKKASMSRSAFSARFTKLVGEPAMQYLTRWRLQLARTDLQQTRDPLAQIAHRIGYATEAAFCKAFKREFGETPSSIRGR